MDINAVDLGLPNGVLWADRNVGAASPEDYGLHLTWGDLSPQKDYSKENYKYLENTIHQALGENISKTPYDAATVMYGEPWRLPTLKEARDFISKKYCVFTLEMLNGMEGYRVTGKKTGQSLFVPFGGIMIGKENRSATSQAVYWTAELQQMSPGAFCPCGFYLEYYEYDPYRNHWGYISPYYGAAIRPVQSRTKKK